MDLDKLNKFLKLKEEHGLYKALNEMNDLNFHTKYNEVPCCDNCKYSNTTQDVFNCSYHWKAEHLGICDLYVGYLGQLNKIYFDEMK